MVRGFCVAFKTEKELHDAYVRDLAQGAVFVPSRAGAEPGTPVDLELDLAFAGQRLFLAGEVVGLVSAAMARAGATPGVSVLLAERGEALRRRLEEASGVALPVGEAEAPHPRRATAPFSARHAVVVEAAGCSFPAETADMSYNGMLALLNGIDLGEGSPVRVWLTHPSTGASIDLDGRVANQTRCDHGVMAVGIQFDYALERVDEVARFIDELRGFHHAKELASVCGSLEETRLEGVLETFAGISSAGTLALRHGEDEGKIAYADGQILCATTGLVSGAKALGREGPVRGPAHDRVRSAFQDLVQGIGGRGDQKSTDHGVDQTDGREAGPAGHEEANRPGEGHHERDPGFGQLDEVGD